VDCKGNQIAVPITGSDAHAIMIVCIAANGPALKPFIVISRRFIETGLFRCGFTPDCHYIQSQLNGSLIATLCIESIFTIYFPDTLKHCERLAYAEIVFFILDGFSGHVTDAIEEACVYQGIRMLTIPPHPFNQVQPLECCLFALHKSESRRVQPHLDLNAQITKLARTVCGFQKAATPVNVIAAFRRARIVWR
jgi:hypothetical protein